MSETDAIFMADRDVSRLLRMSAEWVRGQRHLRRHGKPHVFDLDPVLIGSKPVYPADEVIGWIEARKADRVSMT